MSHPLTNCLSEIAILEERCRQKNARIEALERALRQIETILMDAFIHGHPNIIDALMDIIVCTALDKEQQ